MLLYAPEALDHGWVLAPIKPECQSMRTLIYPS